MESGSGERLPSVDTRQPRIRDSDAIIEVNNLPVDLLHVFFMRGTLLLSRHCACKHSMSP